MWGFPKIKGSFFVFPIVRIIVYWGLWGPLSMETTMPGPSNFYNHHTQCARLIRFKPVPENADAERPLDPKS